MVRQLVAVFRIGLRAANLDARARWKIRLSTTRNVQGVADFARAVPGIGLDLFCLSVVGMSDDIIRSFSLLTYVIASSLVALKDRRQAVGEAFVRDLLTHRLTEAVRGHRPSTVFLSSFWS